MLTCADESVTGEAILALTLITADRVYAASFVMTVIETRETLVDICVKHTHTMFTYEKITVPLL